MNLKETIYKRCMELMDERINVCRKTLNDLLQSAANETKSTAGDKHETALAMLQIEQENTGRQLQEGLLQKAALARIDPLKHSQSVANGSLVKTSRGYFFVSIALGRIIVGEIACIALSPQSPLGKRLLGLAAGDSLETNGVQYLVERVE